MVREVYDLYHVAHFLLSQGPGLRPNCERSPYAREVLYNVMTSGREFRGKHDLVKGFRSQTQALGSNVNEITLDGGGDELPCERLNHRQENSKFKHKLVERTFHGVRRSTDTMLDSGGSM
jgi:hypothetical protein